MNVEFYTGVDQRIDVPVMLPPMLNMVDITGLRVLVADDVADTGRTLELVHRVIESHVSEARCAVLYQKSQSVIDCEYVFKRTDLWINFPWSTEDPIWIPAPLHPERV
jgi:hypoxanthine phosphoribosyltransferase